MREMAYTQLHEKVESESLRKHAMAVEAAMIGYAGFFGEDEEKYAACGLLHDVDYEAYPEEHPVVGAEWLRNWGYDDEFVNAVLGHANRTNTPRESKLAKTLYAVDELASFIIAVALVRPTKLEGMSAKSVKKKLKDKAFARAVNREEIAQGAEELGVDLSEHITRIITYLQEGEEKLKESGLTLL